MSDLVQVAIIGAIPVTLGLFGKATQYVVSLILDAYKAQATATLDAKDRDLAAKDRLIEKLEGRVKEQDGVIRDLRSHLLALGEST